MTRNRTIAALAAGILSVVFAATGLAHGPDPILGSGTLWAKDQVVPFQWQAGSTPTGSIATAIDAGAGDVAESRASRAAVFVRASSANASVAYGGWNPCDSYGWACADRTGMVNGVFGIWFRPHGWMFDWGMLRWCQIDGSNGCIDIERVTLDEFGHIEVLGHHVNYADESDYTDAIVQFAGRVKPKLGWDFHAFGRCDVARLQLEYERRDPGNPVSTCLALSSSMTLAAPATLYAGNTAQFTATLKIAIGTAARNMSGDPLSDRTVSLQRRAIGSSTWTTVATMPASASVEGSYSLNWSPTATYDWRATWTAPSTEGLSSGTSPIVRVTVSGCTGSGCPQSAPRGGGADA